MDPNEIYMRAVVHFRGLEKAVEDGIQLAQAEGDLSTANQLRALNNQLAQLHRKADRIAEPYTATIRPLIGGGK